MCNFYKTMNSFFAKLAMFVAIASVIAFLLIIVYGLYIAIFNVKTSFQFDFNDIALLFVYTIVPFITSINIIKKFEPDDFLKEIK